MGDEPGTPAGPRSCVTSRVASPYTPQPRPPRYSAQWTPQIASSSARTRLQMVSGSAGPHGSSAGLPLRLAQMPPGEPTVPPEFNTSKALTRGSEADGKASSRASTRPEGGAGLDKQVGEVPSDEGCGDSAHKWAAKAAALPSTALPGIAGSSHVDRCAITVVSEAPLAGDEEARGACPDDSDDAVEGLPRFGEASVGVEPGSALRGPEERGEGYGTRSGRSGGGSGSPRCQPFGGGRRGQGKCFNETGGGQAECLKEMGGAQGECLKEAGGGRGAVGEDSRIREAAVGVGGELRREVSGVGVPRDDAVLQASPVLLQRDLNPAEPSPGPSGVARRLFPVEFSPGGTILATPRAEGAGDSCPPTSCEEGADGAVDAGGEPAGCREAHLGVETPMRSSFEPPGAVGQAVPLQRLGAARRGAARARASEEPALNASGAASIGPAGRMSGSLRRVGHGNGRAFQKSGGTVEKMRSLWTSREAGERLGLRRSAGELGDRTETEGEEEKGEEGAFDWGLEKAVRLKGDPTKSARHGCVRVKRQAWVGLADAYVADAYGSPCMAQCLCTVKSSQPHDKHAWRAIDDQVPSRGFLSLYEALRLGFSSL